MWSHGASVLHRQDSFVLVNVVCMDSCTVLRSLLVQSTVRPYENVLCSYTFKGNTFVLNSLGLFRNSFEWRRYRRSKFRHSLPL